jgi:hypothetical protein
MILDQRQEVVELRINAGEHGSDMKRPILSLNLFSRPPALFSIFPPPHLCSSVFIRG